MRPTQTTQLHPPAGELWDAPGPDGGGPDAERGDSYEWGAAALPAAAGAVTQVAAGDSHTVALTATGAVYGWGTYRDASGVFGFAPGVRIARTPIAVHTPTTRPTQAVKIVSGADHTLALTAAGTLLSWGTAGQGALGRVGARLPPRSADVALLTPSLISLGARAPKVADVFAGTYTSFAVTATGKVYGWGLNNYHQLSLPSDAPVWAPTRLPSLEACHAVAVRPGQHHTLALTAEGGVVAFGRPTYGRLGVPTADAASDAGLPTPTPIPSLSAASIVSLAAGLAVSGAVGADGVAWAWGFGDSGQLGKGGDDDEDELAPRIVRPPPKAAGRKAVGLEFGGQHAVLLYEAEGGREAAAKPAAETAAAAPAAPAPAAVAAKPASPPAEVAAPPPPPPAVQAAPPPPPPVVQAAPPPPPAAAFEAPPRPAFVAPPPPVPAAFAPPPPAPAAFVAQPPPPPAAFAAPPPPPPAPAAFDPPPPPPLDGVLPGLDGFYNPPPPPPPQDGF